LLLSSPLSEFSGLVDKEPPLITPSSQGLQNRSPGPCFLYALNIHLSRETSFVPGLMAAFSSRSFFCRRSPFPRTRGFPPYFSLLSLEFASCALGLVSLFFLYSRTPLPLDLFGGESSGSFFGCLSFFILPFSPNGVSFFSPPPPLAPVFLFSYGSFLLESYQGFFSQLRRSILIFLLHGLELFILNFTKVIFSPTFRRTPTPVLFQGGRSSVPSPPPRKGAFLSGRVLFFFCCLSP